MAGLVLAAGASSRMGRAKALVELDGRSFVNAGIELLRAAGCELVLVVDGAHRLDPESLAGARLVHNSRWRDGPLSTLQLGLRQALARTPELDGLVAHHVERPRVRAQTVRALLEAHAREPGGLWQPTHLGRSGHPMLWPRGLFSQLLALDPARDTARVLVRGAAAGLRRKLEVDDPGVLDNIDTPAQLQRVRGEP
ncbi:Nicotine blue oxidoreductase [Enhygromyxa salina]|uniref:Nicotine blue oxidoreductase n=1 Tax=Enhygromyxa salina TaxID=215803 RepID=A0A2S9XK71_9BACT|nr:nucleotidyltransferase family protein [Enhygromyxa salina]PRP93255.1 Nicotine blue oxidoreductase [Enhygromyxa salina]